MQGAGKVSGEAALHVACYHGEADVTRVLIEGGANVNKENEVCKSGHNVCYACTFIKELFKNCHDRTQQALKHCK